MGDVGAELIAGLAGVLSEADRSSPDANPRAGLLGICSPGAFHSEGPFSDVLDWVNAVTLGSGLGRLEERVCDPFRIAAPTEG